MTEIMNRTILMNRRMYSIKVIIGRINKYLTNPSSNVLNETKASEELSCYSNNIVPPRAGIVVPSVNRPITNLVCQTDYRPSGHS